MLFLLAFIFISFVEWVAAGKQWHRLRLVTKPLSMLLLLAWFTYLGGWQQFGFWFGLGLLFSLGGDVFLLMRARFFIAGLFSFLFAHICYILGFASGLLEGSWWILLPLLVLSVIITLAYPRIIRGVRRRIEHRKMTVPVIMYMLTISTMLFFAMLTWFRPLWQFPAPLFASLGALLFTVSDTLLAARQFLRPIRYGNFMVMFNYHLGQLGITTAALLALGVLVI